VRNPLHAFGVACSTVRMADPVIEISGLRKSYGSLEAVRGIDLEVERGEIFAFLGPNGAGKTTTVEILEGYRTRTSGDVRVLGADPARGDREWTSRIGVMLQSWQVEPDLTVRESLEQFAGYYRHPRPVAEITRLVGLTEQADARAGRLSGGQQRRLDMGMALIGDPELLFLDEPTTGFDPLARRAAWEVIASLKSAGKTVFLTTHYMDEAEALADRVAIIVGGEIVASGTPEELAGSDAATIAFRLPAGVGLEDVPSAAGRALGIANGRVEIQSAATVPALHALTTWAVERGIDLTELEVRRRSLEDVYLQLTSDAAL
jgi:ABC-2 type transport system ATP-binding protein